MKLKHHIFSLLIVSLLASCSAHFDRYPGEKLTGFPDELTGSYAFRTQPFFFSFFKKDTASLEIRKDGVYPIGNSEGEPLLLGERSVISKVGKYYALSQRDENLPDAWTVSLLKHDKNNLYIYLIEENASYAQSLLDLFVSKTYIRQTDGSFKKAVIEKKDKLNYMMKSHSDTAVVLNMGEESLLLLFEKYVSKEKPLHLKRVK